MARSVLVTGGNRGIGLAIARALAADGDAVAITHRSGEAPEGLFGVRCDVTDTASVRNAVEEVAAALGHIEVAVNNAGWDDFMPFVKTTEDFWNRILDINFKGALRVCHTVVPGMMERGFGRVVNIGSDAGRVGSSLEAVYSGAKGGIIAFTKTLAREVATKGVTVNTVCPGPTDTPALRKFADSSGEDADKVIGGMARSVPMKRLGNPADVAAAVVFFASDATEYITGQTLSVSGGLTMA